MHIDKEVSDKFEGISIVIAQISGVSVGDESKKIGRLRSVVEMELREKYDMGRLAEYPKIRAYRDFMWNIGIDPTKTRPSAEALIRRVVLGNGLPKVNDAVDAMNIASVRHAISMSTYNAKKIKGTLKVSFAGRGTLFSGIGEKRMSLGGKEVVLRDDKQVLCVYPYRDADATKVTKKAKEIILVGYGVPGIGKEDVLGAVESAQRLMIGACGGKYRGMVSIN